jgi:hypothetical protein
MFLSRRYVPSWVESGHSGGRKRAEGRWYMSTGLSMRLDGRNTISSYSVSTLALVVSTLTYSFVSGNVFSRVVLMGQEWIRVRSG